MKWRILALLLLSSCMYIETTRAQEPSRSAPPQKMRLCVVVSGKTGCVNLVWVSPYYEGRKDGETKLENRYWITQWEDGHIQLTGKTAYAVDGVFPLDATIDAHIAADGAHAAGNEDWRVGYSASGSVPFTLSWSKDAANAIELQYVGQFQSVHYSKTNPNVILPPGASEKYVAYPVDVRALLQPDYALAPKDALRKCNDAAVVDPNLALEIARYAYRAADIARGNCWTLTAGELGSQRAKTLNAVGWQMGWFGPKDDARAFGILKTNLGAKEPWDMLFLMNAYIDGQGTEKNSHEAAIISSYMITHNDTEEVLQMIGSDDASLMRQKARMQVLLDPPTKSEKHCTQGYETPGGVKVPARCDSISVVDNDALRKRLDQIESHGN